MTLVGLLFWELVMLWLLGSGGSVLIQVNVINGVACGTLTRPAG